MDFKIIHISETDSTNHWLRQHGEGEMVVVADYQTAGKGCGTNSWESERGRNLTFSMLIHPSEVPANRQFHITEVVSVALCLTIQRYVDQPVTIKWPNDIYVGDRKICGILTENLLKGSQIKDSIIGIGLNVNQREFVSDAPNPVSLWQLTGQETALDTLLISFLETFNKTWDSKTTCFTYRNLLFRKGKPYLYKTKTTSSTSEAAEPSGFTATLTNVLDDGRMVLVDESGAERIYAFKEVQFII